MHIILIDDHVIFREGMKFLLSDLNEALVFTEAGTCTEALQEIEKTGADLILLDLSMPGSYGLSALREMRQQFPSIPIAVLSGMDDPSIIREAIDEGASGFVPKSSNSEVLIAALQLILAGGIYLPPTALSAVAEPASSRMGAPVDASLLSERQMQVLLCAIQGMPNKIIAGELNIAEGTVKAHLSAAFKVLGVHNRTEAVYAAARMGLYAPAHDQT
ncbi:MAG: DNA-binding NarL/FixJ family response regulator [Bacteroidia bacterium]